MTQMTDLKPQMTDLNPSKMANAYSLKKIPQFLISSYYELVITKMTKKPMNAYS
jgi:hypothetical protein